jgi:protein SCO1/2
MRKNKSTSVFVAVVILLPVFVYAMVSWYERNYQQLPVLGEKGHIVEDFELRNQQGQIITGKDWQNKIVVADFFFTSCLSVCPKMTNNLKSIVEMYKGDDDIIINSFTVDPERDSVDRLKKYAEQFGVKANNWNFLTGNKREIYKLARNSFLIIATDGDGGPEDFIHSEKLVLIDKKKRIRGYYSGTDKRDVNQLINDINKLKHEG